MKKCPECKTLNDDAAHYCSFCGGALDEEVPATPPAPRGAAAPPVPPRPPVADPVRPAPAGTAGDDHPKKSVGGAVLASILFPGLGQTYNGFLLKGVVLYLGITLFSLPGFPSLLLAAGLYLYGIYDAYRTADRMNKGDIAFRDFSWVSIFLYFVFAVAVAIAGTILLAAVAAAADEYYLYTDACDNIFGCS